MKLLKTIFWGLMLLLIGIPLIMLALANDKPYTLNLDLFKEVVGIFNPAMATNLDNVSFPFFYYIFAALLAGVILGGIATWITQSRWRKAARRRTREAHQLRAKNDLLEQQIKLAQQELDQEKRKAEGKPPVEAEDVQSSLRRLTAN